MPKTEPIATLEPLTEQPLNPFAAADEAMAARRFACQDCRSTRFHPLPYGEIVDGEYRETNVNYACNSCGKVYSPEQVRGIVA